MPRRVLYYVYQPVHTRPPCVMEICSLKDKGIEVVVLTTDCSSQIRQLFQEKGILCQTYTYKTHPIPLVQKVMNYFHYRQLFHKFFEQYWTDNSVLWVGSEQSIIRMWPFLWRVHPCILNALEFYEEDWYQKAMRRIAPKMDVLTACEPHRAQYMVDWWHLKRLPYVLRNKPYAHPRLRFAPGSTPEVREAIARIRGKKNLMYQGAINADRDLSHLAQALREAQSEYYLVLSGRNEDHAVEKLQEIYDKTIFLGNISAPLHLEVTSHATICVAFYVDNCINNRFCAPNKIYEYAGCGVPMLCNNIPGLSETVGRAGAAECVDFHDHPAVIQAIKRISRNYQTYCDAAKAFYDETDNTQALDQIVDDAFSRTKAERA